MMLSLALLAAVPQVNFSRFVLDVPGQIIETQRLDANGDGLVEFWLASLEGDRRYLNLFEQMPGGGFPAQPNKRFPVSKAVVAWAVGDFVAEENSVAEIMFTTRDAVYLQPLSGRPTKIYSQGFLLDVPASDQLPVWEEVADINGDGLDDVVLPTREGYLMLQGSGEVISHIPWQPREARAPVASRDLFGGAATATLSSSKLDALFVPNESAGILEKPPLIYSSISLPRPVLVDVNGDGLLDFSFLEELRLRVHLQTPEHTFKRSPQKKFNMPGLGGADNEELKWGHWGGGPEADLMLLRSDSNWSLSKEWTIRIWVDPLAKGSLKEPTFVRKAEGSWVGTYLNDVDGDEVTDLVISAWELNIGLALKEPSVEHNLTIFRGVKDSSGKIFDTRAALAHSRDYAVGDLDNFSLVPALTADLTGDGKFDLLENSGKGELEIHHVTDNGVFKIGKPVQRVPVDALAALVLLEDLNGDGIGDFLVRHYSHWEIYMSRGR
jgi:hypothetical protein